MATCNYTSWSLWPLAALATVVLCCSGIFLKAHAALILHNSLDGVTEVQTGVVGGGFSIWNTSLDATDCPNGACRLLFGTVTAVKVILNLFFINCVHDSPKV
jgi:hypothetical protein